MAVLAESRRTPAIKVSVAALVVAAAALVLAVLPFQHQTGSPAKSAISMPSVLGMAEPDAISRLSSLHLVVSSEPKQSLNVSRGIVFAQEPAGGSRTVNGQTVHLVVRVARSS